MSAPLTNQQKAWLSQLSARAFNRQAALARGRGEGSTPSPGGEGRGEGGLAPTSIASAQAAFRHAEVAKACGKLGLRCCSQDDYKLIEGHFQELLGNHGAAFKAQVKAATETRRVIEHKIVEACKEFGFHLSYANKICTVQNHGATLDDVDEKKLWQIFYTIRNRGLTRRHKQAA